MKNTFLKNYGATLLLLLGLVVGGVLGAVLGDGARVLRAPGMLFLNLVFMLGAIAGVVTYYLGSARLGIIIVLVAMAVKMVECAIRMIVK